jgi:hypothetical protein
MRLVVANVEWVEIHGSVRCATDDTFSLVDTEAGHAVCIFFSESKKDTITPRLSL